jgi:uncharacterized membrane-anchored protein
MRAYLKLSAALLLASATLVSAPISAAEPTAEDKAYMAKYQALPWVKPPAKVIITDNAALSLNDKIQYLDTKGTDDLLKLTGNLPEESSYTIAANTGNWFAVYSFDPMGYVKDDEKIDADALLKSMRDNEAASNVERKTRGLPALNITGWAVPPHYDPASHNLEYGVTLASQGSTNINYHMRMLGRRGVMDAALVTSQQYLQADLAEFRAANAGFGYNKGEDYASYKEGDKVSEYGLAALVTGGVAAAALKGGLLKGLLAGLAAFWKLIAVGVVAGFAAIRRFFGKISGGGQELGPPPGE